MKHYLIVFKWWHIVVFIIFFLGSIVNAQSWLGTHTSLNHSYFQAINSRPNSTSFSEMVGVTGGTNWDGLPEPNPIAHFMQNARSFHLMEIDYRYLTYPSDYEVVPCLNDCDQVICYPQGSNDLPNSDSDKSTFAYYKHRLL